MKHFLNCKECVDLLLDYLEGNLESQTHDKLEKHFAGCSPCLNFLKSYQTCSQMAQQLRDQQVQIPSELEARLKSFLKEEVAKDQPIPPTSSTRPS